MADIVRILRGDGLAWLQAVYGEERRRVVRKGGAGRFRRMRRKAKIDALDIPARFRELEEGIAWLEANATPEEMAVIRERRARQAAAVPQVYGPGRRRQAMEDFQLFALKDACASLLAEMDLVGRWQEELAMEFMLNLYYEREEAFRNSDDEHAKALYQDFRDSFEREYGPMPPRTRN